MCVAIIVFDLFVVAVVFCNSCFRYVNLAYVNVKWLCFAFLAVVVASSLTGEESVHHVELRQVRARVDRRVGS